MLFDFSIAACLIAAVASLLRGKRYVHDELHAGVPAEAAGRLRVTVAEEIEAAERRLASPEPATRYRKER